MALNLTLRKSFLYLFATVGLVLTLTSAVSFIDLGLKTYVFTKADYPCDFYGAYPVKDPGSESTLTREQQDQQAAEEERRCIEQRVSEKQRQAASALARLLVGTPLFLYTWIIIRKENLI